MRNEFLEDWQGCWALMTGDRIQGSVRQTRGYGRMNWDDITKMGDDDDVDVVMNWPCSGLK